MIMQTRSLVILLAALCTGIVSASTPLEVQISGDDERFPGGSSSGPKKSRSDDTVISGGHAGKINYEALFDAVGRTILGERQNEPDGPQSLKNNVKASASISPGETQEFKFPSSEIAGSFTTKQPSLPDSVGQNTTSAISERHMELRRRQANERNIFLTLSVCGQPVSSSDTKGNPPPALELYISSSGQCDPGVNSKDTAQTKLVTEEGFLKHSETRSSEVCVAVRAPDAPGYSGSYDFELAASIDHYYADYHDYQSLYLLDSDADAGLFITTNLTDPSTTDQDAVDQWLKADAPFSIFIHNTNDTNISGLMNSFCGLNNTAQVRGHIGATSDRGLEFRMTTLGNLTGVSTAKQQFYVSSLNASSSYYAVLGLPSNYSESGSDTPTAGGSVWKSIKFETKTYNNCQLVYGLPFCSSVAYSVPSNGSKSGIESVEELRDAYDAYAASYIQGFDYSLQQVPCDTEPEAQYSLATNCEKCSIAYRQWLCAVTIPRCTDYASKGSWLQPRNVGQPLPNGKVPPPDGNVTEQQRHGYYNSSRTSMINEVIKPGPYKEIMPCGDLCYGLVQNCPASLGFSCPGSDRREGFNRSYGVYGNDFLNPQCNFPGAIWGVSAGSLSPKPSAYLAVGTSLLTAAIIYFQSGV